MRARATSGASDFGSRANTAIPLTFCAISWSNWLTCVLTSPSASFSTYVPPSFWVSSFIELPSTVRNSLLDPSGLR